MSGPVNKRIKIANLEVTLDGQPVEIPVPLRNSLLAVYSHLESTALRRGSLLVSLVVDGLSIRLEKPMVPLRMFQRVEAVTARFDDFDVHLLPSLQRKLQHLHNRVEVAAELAMINEWPATQRLWWDLLPDLKEPLLILNLLARLPVPAREGSPNYVALLTQSNGDLDLILLDAEKAIAVQDPLLLSDVLEQQMCPWLREIERGVALEK